MTKLLRCGSVDGELRRHLDGGRPDGLWVNVIVERGQLSRCSSYASDRSASALGHPVDIRLEGSRR